MNDFISGGFIKGTNSDDLDPKTILPGTVVTNEKTYKKYGTLLLRKINNSSSAEIVISKEDK